MKNQLFNPGIISLINDDGDEMTFQFKCSSQCIALIPIISDFLENLMSNEVLISNVEQQYRRALQARTMGNIRKSKIKTFNSEIDAHDTNRLKMMMLDKLKIELVAPAHCKFISHALNALTDHYISETTIKRMFGFAKAKFKFSKFTVIAMIKFAKVPDEVVMDYIKGRQYILPIVKADDEPLVKITEPIIKPDYRFIYIDKNYYYLLNNSPSGCHVSLTPEARKVIVYDYKSTRKAKDYSLYKCEDEELYNVYNTLEEFMGRIQFLGGTYLFDTRYSGEFIPHSDSAPSTTLIGAFARLVTTLSKSSNTDTVIVPLRKAKRGIVKLTEEERQDRPWRGNERLSM